MERSYTWDYATFIILVLISMFIGIYSRISAPKSVSDTKEGFSFATGTVPSYAVLLSVAKTGVGIRIFLGIPAELYYHGMGMWEGLYGVVLAFFIVSFVFMPVYFAMPTTSVYQYLELRFRSVVVRRLASLLYIIRTILMLGVTTFTPCVALRAVIGLPYFASIVSVGTLSIILTIIGGMRGVILNDVMQAFALFACTVGIMVRATMKVPGGLLGAFQVASQRDRLNYFNFDPDPTIRVTSFSAMFGQVFSSLSVYGCQQAFAQRYRSLPDQKTVVRTLLFAGPVVGILESLLWVAGVAIFALYAHCDPLSAGLTNSIDEIVPYFVQKEFAILPGLLGIFMASLFNGALGVAVALLNSLATVTWEDFLSKINYVQHLSEGRQLIIIRILGSVYGIAIMGMAMVVAMLPGLVEASQLISSTTAGPMLGVFLLALLCPPANSKGAICGMVTSMVFSVIMQIGRQSFSRSPSSLLSLSVSECPAEYNVTMSLLNTRYHIDMPERDWITYFFSITFMYYAMLGSFICVLTGVIVSYITASDKDRYEVSLIHPWAKTISEFLPGKPRTFLAPSQFNTKSHEQHSNVFEYITHL